MLTETRASTGTSKQGVRYEVSTSRWCFHRITVEPQSRPHTHSQSPRINPTTSIINLKTLLNFKDTLPQALINKIFLKERQALFQSRRIQDYLQAKDHDIKFKSKDIKSKIKIQYHKHAKGTSKEFPRPQGSKTQDVTRSEASCAMTTP
ncbi:hypothetical protein Tco_0820027 [Tanacetum coccineum]|uniref:Uncharacterized protein n=1 Tax=Tanacetum coccineum TaxID=301880 RepID=A0ABQ5AC86_9ASTR